MWFHLKFAALVSAAWVLVLALQPMHGAVELVRLLSGAGAAALAAAHAALAALFWWGSNAPPHRLVAVYVGLAVFLVRSVVGIYLVLYAMRGEATMIVLVDMVLSIGLLSAIINGLPGALRPDTATANPAPQRDGRS